MSLPKQITIHELGPREGMQIEKNPVSTQKKVELINALSECNFAEIEVVSFVSPKWVPQMADAEQVVEQMACNPNTRYTSVYLNTQGMARALAVKKLYVEGSLSVTASETFSKKNTNRSLEESLKEVQRRVEALKTVGIPASEVSVMAAFGCNFEGDIDPVKVIALIDRLIAIAQENNEQIQTIQLADTMGWANPLSIKNLVGLVQDRWPDQTINLHLHDTRGLGLANVMAALEMGVDDFDSSVGGLGGCPYAGFKDAPGNVVTEDLVHLCGELGIHTGIDLNRLLEVSMMAQEIVGHPLPGKVMHGGSLPVYRRAQGISLRT
ncbi:MAG: hydroxymethylglutaryl-CoA lyase [Burkholderiales bacterium]|jgi:hydroxymethylglutaryl-CoA lyase|uniref:hydroxymethylglutaryl-CoA lyase n=1 Tax=Orrella sp. TaxID=1921583 RepID=UPI00275E2D35|nr:hydroxymethylglutaryl-CoA lyase [Burkholderiales bacterium]